MATTYHPIDATDAEAMKAMRAMFAAQPRLSFGPQARPVFDDIMSHVPAVDGVRYEPARVGGVPGWWCRPDGASADEAILYLHGGGYILGSVAAYRPLIGQVAIRAKAVVFAPDYRLAPEHTFPAAVLDVQAAYDGLRDAGFSQVALMGDSAGGGLALGLLQQATKANPPGQRPVGAVLLSPLTDLAFTGDSIRTRAEADPLLTPEAGDAIGRFYLNGQDPRDPRASPLYGDFGDLPPVLIHVGEDEVLLDDSVRCAERIKAAGGQADLHVWQGMVHVFPSSLALLQASRDAMDHVGAFLRRCLAG